MSQSAIPVMCLTGGQACPVTADFFDQNGNPITPATTPVWITLDPVVATVAPAPDGLSATITGGSQGETFVEVTYDGETSKVCISVEDLGIDTINIIPGGV